MRYEPRQREQSRFASAEVSDNWTVKRCLCNWRLILLISISLLESVISLPAAAEKQSYETIFRSGEARVSLLELFSSEGCSSCPPAEKALYNLRSDSGLWRSFVPIGFHVSYWDRLGWIDKLSSDKFTARQYSHAAAWGSSRVYTPEFVLNGVEAGSRMPVVSSIAAQKVGELALRVLPEKEMSLEFTTSRGAFLQLEGHVALLGNEIESKVTAGENQGATLRHSFVALRIESKPMKYDSDKGAYLITIPWLSETKIEVRSFSLAAWVTEKDSLTPLQAVGGDI